MKSKTLAACLLVAASFSSVSAVVQAGDTPQENRATFKHQRP